MFGFEENLQFRIEKLEKALRPFAKMARDNDDPTELACERGFKSDMTCIFNIDFTFAKEVLEEGLIDIWTNKKID